MGGRDRSRGTWRGQLSVLAKERRASQASVLLCVFRLPDKKGPKYIPGKNTGARCYA